MEICRPFSGSVPSVISAVLSPPHVQGQTCSVLPLTSMFNVDKHAIRIISLFKVPLVNHEEGRCSGGPRGLRLPIGLDDQRARCSS